MVFQGSGFSFDSDMLLRCFLDSFLLYLVFRLWRVLPAAFATSAALVWLFTIWGSADLINAFYQANTAGLLPGELARERPAARPRQ